MESKGIATLTMFLLYMIYQLLKRNKIGRTKLNSTQLGIAPSLSNIRAKLN